MLDGPCPVIVVRRIEIGKPVLRLVVVWVESLPEGKQPVHVAVMHKENGVKPGNSNLCHVARELAEPTSPVVDVVMDEFQVQIRLGIRVGTILFLPGNPGRGELRKRADVFGLIKPVNHLGEWHARGVWIVPFGRLESFCNKLIVDGTIYPVAVDFSLLGDKIRPAGRASRLGELITCQLSQI